MSHASHANQTTRIYLELLRDCEEPCYKDPPCSSLFENPEEDLNPWGFFDWQKQNDLATCLKDDCLAIRYTSEKGDPT